MHSTLSLLALGSALAIGAIASEVNSDDLWGNCAGWQPCKDVVRIAEGCGTEKSVGGESSITA
jgi:hypothetical protein